MSGNNHSIPDSIYVSDVVSEPPRDGEFQTAGVLTIAAGHAIHDTYSGFLPPLLPLFIQNLSLSKMEAGLLSAFMSVPSILQPVIGYVAERNGLRALVVLAPAITGVMMSVLGIAPGYWTIALLLLIVGFSSAGFHSTGPVLMGSLSGWSLGRGMGLWMVGGELGRTLGPLVIVTALQWLTLKGISWLMLGGLVASFLLFLGLRDVPERGSRSSKTPDWNSAYQNLKAMLIPLACLVLSRAFFLPALSTFLPTYLTEAGADLWFAGIALSILEMAGVVGAMLGGTLSDRVGRRTVLVIGTLAAPVLLFFFLAVNGWLQITLLITLGLVAFSLTPVIMALVQESSPENRALANGFYLALNFVLRSGAVVILGLLGDLYGLRVAFQISALLMLLGLFIIPFLPWSKVRENTLGG
jgi:FSR family fosmidomycin resistance protein-like MFS transporter